MPSADTAADDTQCLYCMSGEQGLALRTSPRRPPGLFIGTQIGIGSYQSPLGRPHGNYAAVGVETSAAGVTGL